MTTVLDQLKIRISETRAEMDARDVQIRQRMSELAPRAASGDQPAGQELDGLVLEQLELAVSYARLRIFEEASEVEQEAAAAYLNRKFIDHALSLTPLGRDALAARRTPAIGRAR